MNLPRIRQWPFGLLLLVVSLLTAPASGADGTLMIWDGDAASAGGGWAEPKTAKSVIESTDKEKHKGRQALQFRGSGPEWIGCGWNWHGWYPPDSGTDLSGYKTMRFYVKADGEAKPDDFDISLISNKTNRSAILKISKYVADNATAKFNDGNWHEVNIPLKDFIVAGSTFDPKKVWEFDIGQWSREKRDFAMYLDSVQFQQ